MATSYRCHGVSSFDGNGTALAPRGSVYGYLMSLQYNDTGAFAGENAQDLLSYHVSFASICRNLWGRDLTYLHHGQESQNSSGAE